MANLYVDSLSLHADSNIPLATSPLQLLNITKFILVDTKEQTQTIAEFLKLKTITELKARDYFIIIMNDDPILFRAVEYDPTIRYYIEDKNKTKKSLKIESLNGNSIIKTISIREDLILTFYFKYYLLNSIEYVYANPSEIDDIPSNTKQKTTNHDRPI